METKTRKLINEKNLYFLIVLISEFKKNKPVTPLTILTPKPTRLLLHKKMYLR